MSEYSTDKVTFQITGMLPLFYHHGQECLLLM